MKINIKTIITTFFLTFSLISLGQTQGAISKKEKTFNVFAEKTSEYKIFGYEKTDIQSKKVICISAFTADVEKNPNKCILGSYYDSSELNLKYIGIVGNFYKIQFITTPKTEIYFYIEKKDAEFTD